MIIVATKANSGGSLMLTLGTQMILAGVSLIYTKGFSLDGSTSDFFNAIGIGMVGKTVPIPVIIFLVSVIILVIVENTSSFCRKIHMTGYNAEACRLSGINVNAIKIICYAVSGFAAACGAIILSSRTLGATPTAGAGYEMDALTAIVLGGISLNGGKGSFFEAFLGVFTLGVLGNSMNLLGFKASDQMIVKGIVLILAVFIDAWKTHRGRR
jgi:ribose transport system permease protein